MTPAPPFNLTLSCDDETVERCKVAPTFDSVTPKMLFSASSDGKLAERVLKLNPVKYRELRQLWRYESGQERRPDDYFD